MKKIIFSVLIAIAFVVWAYGPSISQSMSGGATDVSTLETGTDSLVELGTFHDVDLDSLVE